MKILLTGVTGFIGNRILENIYQNNSYSEIRVIVRNKEKLESKFHDDSKIKIIESDILELDQIQKQTAFSDLDIIIHCAAIATDRAEYSTMYRVNVEGTQILAENALEYSPNLKLFFQLSSTGVYGMNLPEDTPITENYPKHPSSDYQKSKWEAEKVLWKMYENQQLPVIMIRPPTMIGPGDDKTMYQIVKAVKKREFPLINNGQNKITIMDVRDLVQAVDLILDNHSKLIGEAFNLYSFRIKLKDYLKTIQDEINDRYEFTNYPYKLVFVAASLSELKDKVLGTTSTKNRYRVRKFGKTRMYNDEKIRKLGFEPQYNCKKSVKDTINWLHTETDIDIPRKK